MKQTKLHIVIILVHLFFISNLFAQIDKEIEKISKPFIKTFTPKSYKGDASNWSVIDDKRGVMYFGNVNGILEFDGNTWRIIQVSDAPDGARTLAMSKDGIIYASAYASFGFLKSDSIGQLQYNSLVNLLADKDKNFGEMWDVAASSKGVFFKSKDKVFRIVKNKVTVWDSVFAFRLYKVNDTIYSRNEGVGLMMIDGEEIKLMPDGDHFKNIGVFDMLPFKVNGKSKILVTTNSEGLYQYDGKSFSPFKTKADAYLKENQIYNACVTANGNFAFATQRGGVVIISNSGELIKIINEDSGLLTNVVYDVYSVEQGGLWLATANGISYLEEPSPFSIIQNNGEFKDKSVSVIRFDNKIYAVNEFGVLYLSTAASGFKLAKGSNKPAYSLLDANGVLVAGTNWGTAVIDNDKLKKPVNNNSSNKLINSKIFPGRIYSAEHNGFSVFQKIENNSIKLIYDKELNDFNNIMEDDNGDLWLVGFLENILHISGELKNFSGGTNKNINYEELNTDKKLPGKIITSAFINGKVLLATDKGVYSIDKKTKRFLPDSTFGKILSDSSNVISLIKKSIKNNYWILTEINGELQLGKAFAQTDNKYKWQPFPIFQRIDLSSINNLYSDYDEKTGIEKLWINTNDGLIIYNPENEKNIEAEYSTLIRNIIADNDSLIYGGTKIASENTKEVTLPFSKNHINIEYSSTNFDNPDETKYQYFLEGNDENWSQWITQTKKEYTNLSQGNYVFHVRAKNIYGVIGSEDKFAFKVLPPWYLTWWAYLLYILIFALGVFIIDRIMRRKLLTKERNRAKLREAELIKKQADELETVDRLVRVINKADNLETLFNSLLTETITFIPQAEKAAVFLFDHKIEKFRIAYTLGYKINDFKNILFNPEELKNRYTVNSEEIGKGIYILNNTDNLFKFQSETQFNKINSMLIMAVEREKIIEAYVVFDILGDKKTFDPSTARILNKFREHAVSAISKAQSLKMLQEINIEIIKTQEKLVTQEKLASLGTLTAGIAHEIKNPLNFVNNFAEISIEIIDELKEKLDHQFDLQRNDNYKEISETIDNLKEIIEKINIHGSRADGIVKSMLLHSRGNSGEKAYSDINDLLEQYLNLAYHGFRAKDKNFNITIERDYDKSINKINIIPQNISRVFLNIINNALYAAYEKKRNTSEELNPLIKVATKNLIDKVEIRIRDNGNGIPYEIRKNLFNPFFTTKPTGEGTGLGLSLSYDIIVKEHSGEIKFESDEGKYAEFIIHLPIT
ncbi:MAG: ATP-binding protein [Melioribacteraceae bacterium]